MFNATGTQSQGSGHAMGFDRTPLLQGDVQSVWSFPPKCPSAGPQERTRLMTAPKKLITVGTWLNTSPKKLQEAKERSGSHWLFLRIHRDHLAVQMGDAESVGTWLASSAKKLREA